MAELIPQTESVFQAKISRLARSVFGRRTNAIEEPIEPFEVKRRRELDADRRLLDAAMDSLLDDIRAERMLSGYATYSECPAASAKLAVLELGRSELIEQRNVVLRELASL